MSSTVRQSKNVPVDRGWAWMIVAGVFMNAFFLIGMVKCFGLIFNELKPIFKASSSLTAVASTMTLILVPILSPITTAMGRRYGTRPVVMIGGSLVTLAYVLTGFATSVAHVLITYGVLYGIGSSMAYAPSLVLVGQYFEKRRSLAMGLATSGSSVGGMVLPVIIRHVFDNYSFQGAFLLMGGCLAHLLVGAALLRPPEFYTSGGKYWACNPSCCGSEGDDSVSESVHYELADVDSVVRVNDDDDGQAYGGEKMEIESKAELGADEGAQNIVVSKNVNSAVDEGGSRTISDHVVKTDEDQGTVQNNRAAPMLTSPPEENQCTWCCHRTFGCKEDTKETPLFNLSLLKRPMYILIMISSLCGYLSYPVPFVFIPSHAKELGVSPQNAAFLISIVAISELVARFVMTPLADLNKIEKYHFMAASLAISGINLLLMPFSKTYASLAAQCAVLGFFSGAGFITMMPVVLVDFVGLQNLSSSFGLILAFSTLPTGGSPALMGHFKDVMGSYIPAFYFCGAITLFGGLILWLKPFVQRLEDRLNENRHSSSC